MRALIILFFLSTSLIPNQGQNLDLKTLSDVEKQYAKGHQLFVSGQFAASEVVWRQILTVLPQTEVIWTNLAVTLENQGKFDEAHVVYKQALTSLPNEENIYINLCVLRTKQFIDATLFDYGNNVRVPIANEAKYYCSMATTAHPNSVKAWQTMGMLHTEIFQYETAVSCLKTAIQLDPRDPKSNLYLSTAYSRKGDLENALKQSKRTIEVAPTAESYHSDGIIQSVCSMDFEGEAIVSHHKAIELHSKAQITPECPSGFTPLFGWENIPENNKYGIQIQTIEIGSDQIYGFSQPRQPDPTKVSGNDRVGSVSLQWKEQDIVLVKMTNVYLEGNTGIFYSGCTVFTGGHKEVSKVVQEFVGGIGKIETVTISEPIGSILQQNPGNYYHWMIEVMSRFLYLLEFVLQKPGNENMKVLVPKMAENFVRQTIVDILGFPESRLLWYDRMNQQTRYFLKEVYHVDWHWRPENDVQPNDLSGKYFPPRQALKKIRKKFIGWNDGDVHSKSDVHLKLVYISREDATVRKVEPDDERKICVALMDLVGPENVEWVSATGMTVQEQIDIFKTATIIVAPHGAGMANMIWAKPGTSVVQFPMNPNTDNCFGYLSTSLDLDFWTIPQINSYYYGQYGKLDELGLRAIINVIETILKEKNFKLKK